MSSSKPTSKSSNGDSNNGGGSASKVSLYPKIKLESRVVVGEEVTYSSQVLGWEWEAE